MCKGDAMEVGGKSQNYFFIFNKLRQPFRPFGEKTGSFSTYRIGNDLVVAQRQEGAAIEAEEVGGVRRCVHPRSLANRARRHGERCVALSGVVEGAFEISRGRVGGEFKRRATGIADVVETAGNVAAVEDIGRPAGGARSLKG
jgi:hypothetical protein